MTYEKDSEEILSQRVFQFSLFSPQVGKDAFERVRHRARKMSFPRRSVGILVFRW